MLLTKTVIIKWNKKTKKHYESKGYVFTKYGDEIEVKVEDLPDGSGALILVQCDNCGKKSNPIMWKDYKKRLHKNDIYYCRECGIKLISKNKIMKTRLKDGKNSLGYWLIKNLSLKQAVEIIVRWDDEKNGRDIREVTYDSQGKNKKGYWFKCYRGLHPSELKSVNSFVKKSQITITCNQCNSVGQYILDTYGENALKDYWDYEKNDALGLNPFKIAQGSNIGIYIFCQEKSYHESYFIRCAEFIYGVRCGYCHGNKVHYLDSLGYLYPEVIPIWSKKNKKTPYDYTPNSHKKAYWKCLDGKHKDYHRTIRESTIKEFRCPECVQERRESFLQEKVRLYLELLNNGNYTILHERRCTIIPKNPKVKQGNNTLPFDNEIKELKLIIEVMGSQHYQIAGFHILSAKHNGTTPEYELHYQQVKDRYKRMYVKHMGYEYLEIPYWTDDNEETYKKLINDKINKNIFVKAR